MDESTGLLLALDTSSEMIGFAVASHDLLLAEAIWRGQRQGTATLLAEAMRALEALGRTQDDLRAVAVAIGPGSFSGLRVGMGIAKGLALGLDIPIIGCPTFAVTAELFRSAGKPVCATIAAGRGRFAYAVYEERDGTMREIVPASHGDGAAIGTALAAYPGAIVCGDLDGAAAAAIRAVAPGVTIPPAGIRIRRPGALAAWAWRRILSGEYDDVVALEPIYLHTAPASAPRATKG